MRISTLMHDPGYIAWRSKPRGFRVFLDGIEQPRVVTADEEEGCIEQTEVNEAGRLIIRGDEAVLRRSYGEVAIFPI